MPDLFRELANAVRQNPVIGSGQRQTHARESVRRRIRDGKRPDTDGYASLQGLRCIWRMYDAEERGVMADLRGLGLDQGRK